MRPARARGAAHDYLEWIAARLPAGSRLLILAPDGDRIHALAKDAGFSVSDRLEEGARYDGALVLSEVEMAFQPSALHASLADDAPLLLVTQSDRPAVESALHFAGFRKIEIEGASPLVVRARRAVKRQRPLLSIIMPAYNERATVRETLDAVLEKDVPGVDKELIIVESNSTDGTREAVLEYSGRSGVTIVLEEKAFGKGHAVRAGLARAAGDFILIQDADREYDVGDYDALIEPLLRHEAAFVLGSRHSGSWKMRHFADQAGVAAFMNFGHRFFLTLLNVLYRQRLNDPFTMYKVFRRDCLHGLSLERNRFDFDIELVVKLIRKGYQPIEIPVNYTSRMFSEGKKISVLRDPWTWLSAMVQYRFSRLTARRR